MPVKKASRLSKPVLGWALYDWANSTFATTVMAGFFPVFFKSFWSYGTNVNESTALLGLGNSAAFLIVALMAPWLGAVADRASAKKRFLVFFAYLGVVMTAALSMVGKGQWTSAVILYMAGIIGFSGANIFYDALLPSVSSEENIDFVSGLGFSLGYLGGGLLFGANVLMTLFPHSIGLQDASGAVRWSFISVALWWGAFTLFTVAWVPEDRSRALSVSAAARMGWRQFLLTLKNVRRLRPVFLFLIAYWFYIDGVDTIIVMAVDYGISIGFSTNDLITSLLLVQFVGFPAALAFGKLGQKWGVRKSIFLAIGMYTAITLWGAMITRREEFYILAVCIALAQGGIQALSRSYYCRLIPQDQSGEFFGFYNMLGKFASIVGPALVGLVNMAVRGMLTSPSSTPTEMLRAGHIASRSGIASLSILFVIGGIIFFFGKEGQATGLLGHQKS